MEFQPIASSSAGNCYVLRSGSQPPLLIDAGIPYTAIQKALNFQVSQVAGCLVSHHHGDHFAAVPKLLGAGIDVYASVDTWTETKTNHHRARVCEAGTQFSVGPWNVMPFDAVHDAFGTFGFLIAGVSGKLVYLTDSAYSKHKFPGVTIFAVECNFSREILRDRAERGELSTERYKRTTKTHMSLEKALEFFAANDLSKCEAIYLLHLSDENSDEEAFKLAVQRATGVPTYVCAKGTIR